MKTLFVLTRPKTCKRELPTVKPDVDNFNKAVFDALNGLVWRDDALIVRHDCEKVYGAPTRVEVTVWYAAVDDVKHLEVE